MRAVSETNRRRACTEAYNKLNGITPQQAVKEHRASGASQDHQTRFFVGGAQRGHDEEKIKQELAQEHRVIRCFPRQGHEIREGRQAARRVFAA
jgi:excinuclease UvrABC helicase subunit UvrB